MLSLQQFRCQTDVKFTDLRLGGKMCLCARGLVEGNSGEKQGEGGGEDSEIFSFLYTG